MRKNKDYVPSEETIKHVDAVLKLMSVMTQDSRFQDAQNSAEKGGRMNMCEVLDRVENRGREKGRAEAMAEVKVKLAEKDEKLAEKDEKLAEKDEEIRRLKEKLARLEA
jgi:uncharacterized protein (DUF3084 family)